MFNIDKVDTVYLACGITDLRKSIDGLIVIVQDQLNLDPFKTALFVFCNKQMNRIKILHFDEGFWLYYYRLENGRLNDAFFNYSYSDLMDLLKKSKTKEEQDFYAMLSNLVLKREAKKVIGK
ncbi:IS66 family insertion sequence element accessory protein TnpB [Clostridium butyricum]|uniref:IS66 family insertion sequence element accessory protein TnpB n=1 Tax=Clostridium butyricum TaxID=1492 RepID=UPI00374FD78A